MSYKIISHPADTGIEIEADNLEGVLRAAVEGFNATIFEHPELVQEKEERTIKVSGEDVKELLVNFLTEVLVLLDSERFVAKDLEFKNIDEKNVEVVLKGGPVDLEKMSYIVEIKAITYHQLEIEKKENKWHARIIFDV